MAKQSFMVAVIGAKKAVIASTFDATPDRAQKACAALFMDVYGERGEAIAFDTGAKPGIWWESSPEYIRSVVA